jgi:hypothetical protein
LLGGSEGEWPASQSAEDKNTEKWIPAFAGMTNKSEVVMLALGDSRHAAPKFPEAIGGSRRGLSEAGD